MSVKSKQRRIEKKRKEAIEAKLAKDREWEKIKSISTNFSSGPIKGKRKVSFGPTIVRASEKRIINSVVTTESLTGPSIETVRYEGEMLEREKAAQLESERKSKRVGILVNKSAYQYITDGMDPKTLGRK